MQEQRSINFTFFILSSTQTNRELIHNCYSPLPSFENSVAIELHRTRTFRIDENYQKLFFDIDSLCCDIYKFHADDDLRI